jgi:orotidine-5'-phosphate decarboxylase
MTKQQLFEQIQKKRSFLCVGLDSDLERIPEHLKRSPNPILEFNKQIIEATKDHCIAYKFNIAFYEALGAIGWETMQKTLELIPDNIFTIADAKRGDIGNTSKKYAEAFFKALNFDSITLSPYMGEDTVKPFLEYEGKWSIILALTSNDSSKDFQFLESDDTPLFETVTKKISDWGTPENTMLVVGATQTDYISRIRKIVPNHFFLVPGVGAQGGNLAEVCEVGLNKKCGLLINSSRGIIYAGSGENFAQSAKNAAIDIQQEMEKILEENKLV